MSNSNTHTTGEQTAGRVAEDDLVAALKGRSREAMGTLYDMYSAALYGAIHRIVGSDEIAEDVLQESLVKVWRNIDSYDRSRGRLFTWLINIARHQALDRVKSKGFQNQRKNQDLDTAVRLIDASASTSYNPEQIGVREMMESLDSDYRKIVELIYFEGYTHSEVSEHLGIPLGTVKTRLRAAIMVFRKAFA
jgi:RNA polymerase sigma-70 factor (ECF subfamily)